MIKIKFYLIFTTLNFLSIGLNCVELRYMAFLAFPLYVEHFSFKGPNLNFRILYRLVNKVLIDFSNLLFLI